MITNGGTVTVLWTCLRTSVHDFKWFFQNHIRGRIVFALIVPLTMSLTTNNISNTATLIVPFLEHVCTVSTWNAVLFLLPVLKSLIFYCENITVNILYFCAALFFNIYIYICIYIYVCV